MTATLALAPWLPITVDVAVNASVAVETTTRTVAMSRFSDRARRLALDLGPGTHTLATTTDLADLDASTLADLADVLDY